MPPTANGREPGAPDLFRIGKTQKKKKKIQHDAMIAWVPPLRDSPLPVRGSVRWVDDDYSGGPRIVGLVE